MNMAADQEVIDRRLGTLRFPADDQVIAPVVRDARFPVIPVTSTSRFEVRD